MGTPLREWDINIYRGVLTGYNDAFIIDSAKKEEILLNCKTEEERLRTTELIRPILRGRDIKRYRYDWAELWLIYIPWHFPLHKDPTIQGASKKAEDTFKMQYPAVYQHLIQYKPQLSARNKAETGIRYEWYAMQRWGANYSDDFNKPKIVYAELARTGNAFTLDMNNQMISNTSYMITFDKNDNDECKLYCLLGFLNSLATLFYLDVSCSRFDENGWRWLRQYVENIPIPQIISIELYNEVANALKTPTDDIIKKINNLIFAIIGLDLGEINYLERKFAKY